MQPVQGMPPNSGGLLQFSKRVALRCGIDARVGSGLLYRFLTMAAGPVTALLIAWRLSLETQGLYYLFGSLLALRILFDLGAGTSVLQVAAHARGLTEKDRDSKLEIAFSATVRKLFSRLALAYVVVTVIAGSWFLAFKGVGDFHTLSAWIWFALISGLQFASEGRWGLLAGADLIPEVNRLRAVNCIMQNGVQWSALLCGCGLYSFCLGALAAYVLQEYSFRKHHAWLYYSGENDRDEKSVHFAEELKRLIKRSSQTYLTGYFVFQIQQPICFHLLGAAASARLGFTQSLGGAMLGIPGVWIAMNFPKLNHEVADGNALGARAFFITKWRQVLLFSVLAFVGACTAVSILAQWPRFSERLLTLPHATVLFLALTIQSVALAATYWPRAFKQEPFVRVAYLQMIATPVLLWVLSAAYGLMGTVQALLVSWILGAGGIYLIVRRYLK